jgi:hypothetical protein
MLVDEGNAHVPKARAFAPTLALQLLATLIRPVKGISSLQVSVGFCGPLSAGKLSQAWRNRGTNKKGCTD